MCLCDYDLEWLSLRRNCQVIIVVDVDAMQKTMIMTKMAVTQRLFFALRAQ